MKPIIMSVYYPRLVEAAVKLSNQHILDRRLPDKAFDLLDFSVTYIRLPDPETISR